MSGFSNVLKNGWHPDKNADFKKQVTGIWKKDDSAYDARADHVSRPLSSLRDPDSFGPPPRHVALGSEPSARGTAVSTHHTASSTGSGSYAGSHTSSHHALATPARPSLPSRPRATSSATEEDEEPQEPQPYRMDTTGLNTSHLPPPPTRRDGSGISRSPVPPSSGPTKRPNAVPPGLPPRLPPRSTPSPNPPAGAGHTSTHPPPPPRQPAHPRVSPATTGNTGNTGNDTHINQDAVNRLGRAGISVPGLGIGGPATSVSAHSGQAQPTALSAINSLVATSSASTAHEPVQTVNHAPPASQLGELQARFAKMGTGGGVGGGTSRTPSRSPARLRANSGALSGAHSSADVSGSSTPALSSGAAASIAAGKKKPPPPPPAKKPGLAAVKPHAAGAGSHRTDNDDDDAPPPIPMATRPQGW